MLRYAIPCYAIPCHAIPCHVMHSNFPRFQLCMSLFIKSLGVCVCVCYLSPSHGYGYCWMCSALLLRISRHTTVTTCLHTMVCTTVNTITFDIILFTVLCMHHLQFSLTEGRCCADNIINYIMNYETAMTTAHIHTFTKQEN